MREKQSSKVRIPGRYRRRELAESPDESRQTRQIMRDEYHHKRETHPSAQARVLRQAVFVAVAVW